MTVKDADTLKSYFNLSKVPVPSNYVDLVDTIFAQGGGGGDHDHDDRYVRLTIPNTISAVHTFSPSTYGPPFILSSNAQGQTVIGLKADQLNKSISVSGLGLSGGGSLDGDRTITLTSSSNPGTVASILASDSAGRLWVRGREVIGYGDYASMLNGFWSRGGIFIPELYDAFVKADVRYSVSISGDYENFVPANLFDGTFGTPLRVGPETNTAIVTINLIAKGEPLITYANGSFYITDYYVYGVTSVSARIHDNHAGTWQDLGLATNISSDSYLHVWKIGPFWGNYLDLIEFTFVGKTNNYGLNGCVSNIVYHKTEFEACHYAVPILYQDIQFWTNFYMKNSSMDTTASISTSGIGFFSKIGIAEDNPSYRVEVALATGEVMYLKSTDSSGTIMLGDIGGVPTRFYPGLIGMAAGGGSVSTTIMSYIDTDDNTASAALILDSRINGGQVVNRPLLAVSNYGTPQFYISASGYVGIKKLPDYELDVSGITQTTSLRTNTITNKSGDNVTLSPTGDVTLNPGGFDVLPETNYLINLGALYKKYLTIHAAELWVDTLVAHETIATIGGRILVAPTTSLIADASGTLDNLTLNPGFENLGAGGLDIFANWTENTGSGTITADGTIYHGGLRSCKLTAGIGNNTYIASTISSPRPGDGLVLKFWSRGNGATAGRFAIYDNFHANFLVPITSTGNSSTTWYEYTTTFVLPAGWTTGILQLYCPGSGASSSWFDDITLYSSYFLVKHNNMQVGDIMYMEARGFVEFVKVLSGPNIEIEGYSIYVQRDLDGTGPNDWIKGDALLNTGQTNDGFIDIYSEHSMRGDTQYGPTIVGNIRTGGNYSDIIEGWAIGNLNGIYGYGEDTFGVALGKYVVSSSFITVDASAGIRMQYRNASAQNITLAQWDMTGLITIGDRDGNNDNIQINSTGMYFNQNGTTTLMSLTTAGVITIGATSIEHISMDGTSLKFLNGATQYGELNASTWTLGITTGPHTVISSSGIQLKNSSTVNVDITSTGIVTIGSTSGPHTIIQSTGIQLKNSSTVNVDITSAGVVTIGATTGGNVYISATGIGIRYGTTTYISLDTSGNALFGLTGSGKANIYWNVSNSRLEFRTNTTPSSWIDTDGSFVISLPASYSRTNALVYYNGTNDVAVLDAYGGAASHVLELRALSVASHDSAVTVSAGAPTTYGAYVLLSANDVDYSAAIQIWADGKSELQFTATDSVFSSTIKLTGGIYVGSTSTATEPGRIYAAYTETLTAGQTDDYASALRLAPGYIGSYTVTRHNYISLINPTLVNGAVVTDAAALHFPAAAGTHKAVDSGTTKTTPGAVNAWVKININGTIYYIPSYTSKTS